MSLPSMACNRRADSHSSRVTDHVLHTHVVSETSALLQSLSNGLTKRLLRLHCGTRRRALWHTDERLKSLFASSLDAAQRGALARMR